MSTKITPKIALKSAPYILTAVTVSLLALLGGCSGSNGNSGKSPSSAVTPVSTAATRKGRVQLTVQWPKQETGKATGRYIPAYASSLFFSLQNKDYPQLTYDLPVNRPDTNATTQTVQFSQLIPAGKYALVGFARTEKDGLGATVANAGVEVDVQPDVVTNVDLTLNSTIKSIDISGQPLFLPLSVTLQLTGRALDPDGKTLFVPGTALQWSIVSGSEFATLTSDGKITATATGTVRVRYAEVGAGVSSEADVIIRSQTAQPPQLAQSSWPKFRGDVQNTGHGGGFGATGVKNWEADIGGDTIYSSPAIGADGTIYIGGGDGKVYALDGATGAKKWDFKIGSSAIYSSPAIGLDGTVYISGAVGAIGSKVSVFALDGATGAKKWEFVTDFANGSYGSDTVSATPAIGTDGTVYVGGGNKVFALDGMTGAKKWQFVSAGMITFSSPAIGVDGTIYIGDTTHDFTTTNADFSSGTVYAIDSTTGAKKWEFDTGGSYISSSPAVGADGTVYVIGIDNNKSGQEGTIFALIGATGAKKWQFSMGYTSNNPSVPSPAIGSDGVVYVTSQNTVYALNGTTGVKKWEFAGFYFGTPSPAVGFDGTVYVAGALPPSSNSTGGAVYALDGATGNRKWVFTDSLLAPLASSPAIGLDGTIYIGSGLNSGGKVYAIK